VTRNKVERRQSDLSHAKDCKLPLYGKSRGMFEQLNNSVVVVRCCAMFWNKMLG